jgi:ACS family D-galactonate transporter-like MFS transporter
MPNKKYPWVVVALLWLVALLNYMDRQMLSTMRPSMQIDIVELKSAENFGILMAIFLWIYGLMSPVAGMIADRTNRKWLIVGSLFVWSGVTFAMGFTTSFYQLYWLRAIMGVSEALYIPAGLSLIADYHTGKTRSLAIGIHMTGLYMGQALGGFGATMAASLSWQSTFMSFGLIGMVYSIVLILFLRESKSSGFGQPKQSGRQADSPEAVLRGPSALVTAKKASPLEGIRFLFSNPSFWILLLYFTIPSLPGWAVKNWLPTLFSETLGIDMATAGPMATITTSGSSLIGVLIGGFISDRWVQKNTRGRVFTSAIGLALTIPALILIGFGTSLAAILLAAFCFGFGFGLFDANNMPILCQLVPSKYRATGYGLMNLTGIFSGALITDLLGKFSDEGNLSVSFAWLAAIVIIVLLIQLFFLRPKTIDYAA